MKKITILIAVFWASILCFTSCSKDDSVNSNNNNTSTPSAKYLTTEAFASSSWSGNNNYGDISLAVKSKTNMTLNYYKATSITKHTEEPTLVTIDIAYTFDETKGTFTGSGNDNFSYSGTLTSTTQLSLKAPFGTATLTKE
jgi:hypothetical protein